MDRLAEKSIVFFDGVCNLCNHTVNVLIDQDTQKRLFFAPLQGTTFRTLQIARGQLVTKNLPESIVFFDQGSYYVRSKAILKILWRLGGAWKLLYIMVLIPPPIRDWLYNFIARHRYGWFGSSEACRIPTPDLQARFLD